MNKNQQRLNQMRVAVDARLHHFVSSGVTPGVSYALLAGGDVYTSVFGNEAIRPETVPLQAHRFYDLASLTKVLGTTPLFLQAVAEGRLALNQPLRTILPDFSGGDVTFQELLTHTSGLAGYIPHRDELPPDQLEQALITQLHEGPERGVHAVYRDFNLLLTGWALERVYGGVPIQQLITTHVLNPLHLEATFTPTPTLCVPTTYSKQAGLLRGHVHDPKSAILGTHSGAAGLFATLDGVVKFVQSTFDAKSAVMPTAWAQTLQRDYTAGERRSIGFNLRYPATSRRPWLYHTGYTGTFVLFDPTAQLGLVVLTNRVHPVVHEDFLKQRDELIHHLLEVMG